MQVQAIYSQNKQPSFGAIKVQNELLKNKNRKTIFDSIADKLNEVDPSDKLKRSYVERAERYGYDILFSKDEKRNSVRVDVVSTLSEQKAAVFNGVPIYDWTLVGTYSKPEEFNIQHFNNIYKPNEKETKTYASFMTGFLGVLITAVVGLIGYNIKKDLDSVKGEQNTTVVIKDSLKTDSVKPIIEDSFKLGKNVIKK